MLDRLILLLYYKSKCSNITMSELLQNIIISVITALFTAGGFYYINILLDKRRGKTSANNDLAILTERLDNLISQVGDIKQDFKKHAHTEQNQLIVEATSPLHFTEKGKEYFEDSGCKAYFEEHLQEWLEKFKELDKDYTIHNKAREFMKEKYKQDNDSDFEDIKAYMFNEGISYDQTLLMLSVGLRDMICEKKGITIKRKEQIPQ